MYRTCSLWFLLLSLVNCIISLDLSQVQVYPKLAVSKVFLVTSKNYNFNASQAVEVCTSLSVRIASRDEVESANKKGLQTCRYGWVEEQVAVIPRVEKNDKCGQNRTGILVWRASPDKFFDVFCYNSTAQSETPSTTTQTSTTSTQSPTETPNKRSHTTTSYPLISLSTLLNKNILPSFTSEQSFSTSTILKLFYSTIGSVNTRSNQSPPPSTTRISTQYQLITSSPLSLYASTSQVSSTSSMTSLSFSSTDLSSHLFTRSNTQIISTVSSHHTDQTESPTTRRFDFEDVTLACIVIAAMLFLIAALGAVWYFKIKRSHRLPSWVRIRTKDMFETEMWKYTEQEHYSKHNENKNCADDITLMMEDYSEPC